MCPVPITFDPPTDSLPLWIGGRATQSAEALAVLAKGEGSVFARTSIADRSAVESALAAGFAAREAARCTPAHARRDALRRVAADLSSRAEDFAKTLVAEVGKTIREARAEVARAVDTIVLASEEATRIGGRYQTLDISPRGEGLESTWKRVPIGLCSFITPFNFPLNLAAHKIGPAIAAGCPFVLKPDPRTPIATLMLGEILAGAGLPEGAFSILTITDEQARDLLVTDGRIAMLSFTGSPKVGWALRARAGTKRVTLELGGNAACIVDETADLEHAAARITFGAFAVAGQSCISVQRVLIHRSVYDRLLAMLVDRARRLVIGDPRDEKTDVGPMIGEQEAARVQDWIQEARARGARVLCGGGNRGSLHEPTLLENVPADLPLWCQEVFGPVAALRPFDSLDEAFRVANDSRFGLQAGIFTSDLERALAAWDALEVGGVIVNDVPTMRVDSMPYGGVKESGLGREGVAFAIEEMTELRSLVVRRAKK